MPKLPQVTSTQLISTLRKLGFQIVSQKGSHIKMRDQTGKTAIIPHHRGTIKKGTLKKGILNPLGISVNEFIRMLK